MLIHQNSKTQQIPKRATGNSSRPKNMEKFVKKAENCQKKRKNPSKTVIITTSKEGQARKERHPVADGESGEQGIQRNRLFYYFDEKILIIDEKI